MRFRCVIVVAGNVHVETHLDTFLNVPEGLGCAFISPAPRQCSSNFSMTSATWPCLSARSSKAKPSSCSQVSWRSEATWTRSEEHKSELQYLMRTSYAVSCLKKKK